jgi:hypothetical protein
MNAALHQGSSRTVLTALVCAGGVTVAAGLSWWPERTWPTVLMSNLYVLSLSVAGALWISILYLSGAGWWVVLRRVLEAMMSPLPIVAVLMFSLYFGRQTLYQWADPIALSRATLFPSKAAYLSPPFFFARMAIVLGAWVLLARVIRRVSLRQDRDPAPEHHQSLVRWSAIFVVVFGLTILPASVDWVMSLDPHWASTIFAVYLVAGVLQSGLAALTIIVVLLRERGPLAEVVRDDHLHDLGKLLLGFSTFWAYMWLSQYLLIWYANLPEEVSHYIRRTSGGWLPLFLLNVTINWVVPFLVLLPRSAKRHHRVLLGVSLLVLLGHWLDLYLLVMPEMRETPSLNAAELIVAAGYMGLFLLMTSRALAAAPLVPLHDPYLSESLNHGG